MDDSELETRRSKLREQVDAYEATKQAEEDEKRRQTYAGYAAAFRLSTEFVSAVVVGIGIGYGLDWLFGTLPLFVMLFLVLGFAAGVLNVLRSAGLIQTPQVGKRPPNGGDGSSTPPQS